MNVFLRVFAAVNKKEVGGVFIVTSRGYIYTESSSEIPHFFKKKTSGREEGKMSTAAASRRYFYVAERIPFDYDFRAFNFDAGLLRKQNENLYEFCYGGGSREGRQNVSCMNLYGYTIRDDWKTIDERDVGVVSCLGIGYTVYSEAASFDYELRTGEDEVVRRVVKKNGFCASDGNMGFERLNLVRKTKMAPPYANQYFDNCHTTLNEFVFKTNGRFPCTKCGKEYVDTKCFVCKDRLCGNCHVTTSKSGYCWGSSCDKKLNGDVSCTECHGTFCIDCHREKVPKCDPKSTVSTIIRTNVLDLEKLDTLPDPTSLFVNRKNVSFNLTTAVVPQKLPWVSSPTEEFAEEGYTISIY